MSNWHRRIAIAAVCAVFLTACTSSTEETTTTSSTSTTSTTQPPPPTTTTTEDPCPAAFCITYHIREEAVWSDGTPVTSADFIYTSEVFSDADNPTDVRRGYELIESIEALGEKTVLVSMTEVYGAWRTLFGIVLPAHVSEPADFSVTASAFRLVDRIEGDRLVLRRNSNYWADLDPLSMAPLGDVASLEYAYIPDLRDRLLALESQEIDVMDPEPIQWLLDDLAELDAVNTVLAPGAFWEHIDFNHDDPLLSNVWLREAIALGMDRPSMVAETIGTLDSQLLDLGNSIWMTNSTNYEDHFELGFDPERAEQILIDNGCARGDDGVHVCDGSRLTFRWATTLGDPWREIHAERAREDLEQIGIEIVLDFRTPSDLFASDVLFGGPEIWQMINFSWRAAADPVLSNTLYHCQGSAPSGFGALNVNRYCNPEVESLVRSTDLMPDETERAETYNRADEIYLGELAMVPLYQTPDLVAWGDYLAGPSPNLSRSTLMWNLASWAGKDTVVFGLQDEPSELSPIGPWDDDTAKVVASLTSGAFGITPDLQFVPVLIETADYLVGGG